MEQVRGCVIWIATGFMGLTLLTAPQAAAAIAPAKPYGQIVEEVMAFLFSDVGDGGIRTNDNDPLGYAVPPYFYHFAVHDDNGLWSSTTGYPWHSAISYPAYTASVAIDAFLDFYRYSGDPEALLRARTFADWIIEHRTPAGGLYAYCPYSTQAEGEMGGAWDGDAIMTDKPAMFGVRLLRLFEATGDSLYWNAATEIAATLTATQMTGGPSDDGRWPFRVRPSDGLVRQDYTSHLQPAVRFFDRMFAYTDDPAHAAARDRAWQWLLDNPCHPASTSYQRWEAFYEDQDPDMQTGKRDHYSAHEMIVELIVRQPPGWQQTAVDILSWAAGSYLIDQSAACLGAYIPVTNEWEGWMEPTYAASLQYARTSLWLFEALTGHALQDSLQRVRAHAMAAACSHGQCQRGVAADGRMYTTVKDILCSFTDKSWYEQDFNTVKYYLELMALDPALAPAGEDHMLRSDREILWIVYGGAGPGISYQVFGGEGCETLRLVETPLGVMAAGQPLPRLSSAADPGPGWHWDTDSGVLTVLHATDPVQIAFGPTAVRDAGHGEGFAGRRDGRSAAADIRLEPASAASRPEILLTLAEEGRVSVCIHDLRGRPIRSLLRASNIPAGGRLIRWDGRDDRGRFAASGAYLLRVTVRGQGAANDRTASTKIILIR
jgi:hypothetical protein